MADRLLNDFAVRSFRDIADGDYIAARLAYRNGLVPQFLWSSQQALEKYMKCALLLNRIPATRIRHSLRAAMSKLLAASKVGFDISDRTRKFIEYIDDHGQYRYFETSYYVRGPALSQLDWAVWEVRRYAELHDYEILTPAGKRINAFEAEIRRLRASANDPHSFRIIGGLIERILADRGHAARGALVWNNLFYGRRRRRIRMRTHFQVANAPLFLHPEVLDVVAQYVLIPKEVLEAYRQIAADRLKEEDLPLSS